MPDPYEEFGDPPPSQTEPQDGGLTPSQIRWILSLTPEQRLKMHDGILELVLALREAGGKLHGRDTRAFKKADEDQVEFGRGTP